MNLKAVRVRVLRSGKFKIQTLQPKRRKIHGFGTFFWHIKEDEIDIDHKAVEALRACVNREYSSLGDLFGFNMHDNQECADLELRGPYLAYSATGSDLTVPPEDVTIDLNCHRMLERAAELTWGRK
jgi:hypothetical protein